MLYEVITEARFSTLAGSGDQLPFWLWANQLGRYNRTEPLIINFGLDGTYTHLWEKTGIGIRAGGSFDVRITSYNVCYTKLLRKHGIKVHREKCPNAAQMCERYPYRVIKAKWRETTTKKSFLTTIFVSGTDEMGIVSEISHIVAKDIGSHMKSINIESDKGHFEGRLQIYVNSIDHLEFLIQRP